MYFFYVAFFFSEMIQSSNILYRKEKKYSFVCRQENVIFPVENILAWGVNGDGRTTLQIALDFSKLRSLDPTI